MGADDYQVTFLDTTKLPVDRKNQYLQFQRQNSIFITKKTKKSEREVDLKPLIYKNELKEDDRIFLQLATGSVENIKPELVIQAFARFMDVELPEHFISIHRLELYTKVQDAFVSLEDLGVVF